MPGMGIVPQQTHTHTRPNTIYFHNNNAKIEKYVFDSVRKSKSDVLALITYEKKKNDPNGFGTSIVDGRMCVLFLSEEMMIECPRWMGYGLRLSLLLYDVRASTKPYK